MQKTGERNPTKAVKQRLRRLTGPPAHVLRQNTHSKVPLNVHDSVCSVCFTQVRAEFIKMLR